jgi:outer membrane protein assembly factor BamB
MRYTSPVLTTIDGVEQVLIVSVPGVMSVDLKTGKTLWKHPFKDRNAIPDALPIGDGKVFLTSGYGVGSEVIQVARADDGSFEVRSLGKNEAGSQIHTPLVVGEHIYAVCNAKSRSDGMVCFDQKCDILWKTGRKPNLSRGSQILTGDGLIYALDGRHGNLLIIEPNPKGYKELSRTEPVISGSEIWAPMSLAEGRLIVRDHDKMKCLNVKP